MNHIYRIVWNQTKACWQAVCETANGHPRGTSSRRASGTSRNAASVRPRTQLKLSHAALLCGFGLMTATVGAAPTGGQVSAGTATISQSGATTTIQQASQKAAIDWTGFSVGKTESVRFNQPNASAITLNRVTGTERSEILGSLSANGQVFILNPNGVLFGKGAQVNVGGLVASTLRMSNDEFMAGNFRLTEGPNARASVSNEGEIRVAEGGVLALIAPVVTNTGTLAAPQGSVLMAAADAVSVTLQDGSLVSYTLDKGNLQALVDNGGVIHAEGGHVVLTAKGLDALSKAVVNHSGIIEAQTVATKNGVVELLGDMELGQVNLSGRVDASAPSGGDGGSVEARAETVTVSGEARVTTLAAQGQTGNWMIVGADHAIASSGGVITGALLSANLADTNVTIRTGTDGILVGNGQISVNDVVSWSSNTLTLVSGRNIYINATMNGGSAAGLALEYGLASSGMDNPWDYFLGNGVKINLPAGPSFSIKIGVGGPIRRYTVINSLGSEEGNLINTLQGIGSSGFRADYALGADIDAAETQKWNSGAGFRPATLFGSFDGFGHSISNLYINRPSERRVGLFSLAVMPRINNSFYNDIDQSGKIKNLSVIQATVIGKMDVGIIAGAAHIAGLNLSSSGYVEAKDGVVGGLVGEASGGSMSSSFSNASVRGLYNAGGLIGAVGFGVVADSYATGDVTSTLVQEAFSGFRAGGLIGSIDNAKVLNCYSTGRVLDSKAGITLGGLIGGDVQRNGLLTSTVSASYFDSEKSGTMLSAGGEPRSTAEMQQKKTFSGWDFNNTWRIVEGSSYPMLRALTQGKITLTAAARDVVKVYDQVPWFGGSAVDYSGFVGTDFPSNLSGSIQWGGTSQGAIDAGMYTLIPSGLYSQKYEIDFKPATLYIAPRILDVSVSKPYDGSGTFKTGFNVKNVLPGDTVNITGEATVAGVDAGTYTAFTSNTLSTGNKNYTLRPVNTPNYSYGSFGSVTATIDPLAISHLAVSGKKIYDGRLDANWYDITGLLGVLREDLGKVAVVSGKGVLDGKDVGSHALVSLGDLLLGGEAAKNYTLSTLGSRWEVSPRAVSLTGEGVYDKSSRVYLPDTDFAISIGLIDKGKTVINGLIDGEREAVGFSGFGELDSYNSGIRKFVGLGTLGLTGEASKNYRVDIEASRWKINPKSVKLDVDNRQKVVEDKYYDSSDLAIVHAALTVNDLVDAVYDARFSDSNVGERLPVFIKQVRLEGENKDNYVVSENPLTDLLRANLYADIKKQPLMVSATSALLNIGDKPPVELWHLSKGSLFNNDRIVGRAEKIIKENGVDYYIRQGSLSAPSENYSLDFLPGSVEYRKLNGMSLEQEIQRSQHATLNPSLLRKSDGYAGHISYSELGESVLTKNYSDAWINFMLNASKAQVMTLRDNLFEKALETIEPALLQGNYSPINLVVRDKAGRLDRNKLIEMVDSHSENISEATRVGLVTGLTAVAKSIESYQDGQEIVDSAMIFSEILGVSKDLGEKIAENVRYHRDSAMKLDAALGEYLKGGAVGDEILDLVGKMYEDSSRPISSAVSSLFKEALDSGDYGKILAIKDVFFMAGEVFEVSDQENILIDFIKNETDELKLLKIVLQQKFLSDLMDGGLLSQPEIESLRTYEIVKEGKEYVLTPKSAGVAVVR